MVLGPRATTETTFDQNFREEGQFICASSKKISLTRAFLVCGIEFSRVFLISLPQAVSELLIDSLRLTFSFFFNYDKIFDS